MPRNAARGKSRKVRPRPRDETMVILSKNPFYLLVNFGGWQLSFRSMPTTNANDNIAHKSGRAIELTAEEEEILSDALG
jgi:hypothetical protein